MNKKIIVFLMVFVLIFSLTSCKESFDHEKAMDEAMETIQNATKAHTYSNFTLDNDFGVKVSEILELADEETITNKEDLEKIGATVSNINFVLEQKVDLDSFVIDMNMLLNYESEKFVNISMFMNDDFIFFNEPDLLRQGAMVKFGFLNDMMAEMPNAEATDLIGTIKGQVVDQQQMTQKFLPIMDQIIEENVSEPEVLETTIEFQGKDLKTNEVKYSMDYVEALELVRIFLDNEEFMSLYEEVLASQADYMSTMSGGMPMQSEEEMIQEFNEGIDEAKASIDEILADAEAVAVLENYNLDVSYYFDKGIKSIKYDFDFFSVKSDYYSIDEELAFDTPTEETSYVIQDQMGLYGIMGILNQEAIENLQNHQLVTDFNELQQMTPEY
ncbi:MAG TPA: hypothetical protein VJ962_01245 [Clostridia bacterium]|nr:hypothetical protein [Clostridia bacterium]